MTIRLLTRGLAALGAFVLVVMLAATAVAQPTPLQVAQGSDGTLYLVLGGTAWTVVPVQLSDDQVAALNISGEIDGNIPANLVSLPPLAAPPAAPAAPAAPAPITGTANLTGQVASDVPGTPIAVDATISSVVDVSTKPKDVFAIALTGGTNYRFQFSSPNKYGTAQRIMANVLNPDLSVAVGGFVLDPAGTTYCEWATGQTCPFTPAVSATYYLQVSAFQSSGAQYTFTVRQP